MDLRLDDPKCILAYVPRGLGSDLIPKTDVYTHVET